MENPTNAPIAAEQFIMYNQTGGDTFMTREKGNILAECFHPEAMKLALNMPSVSRNIYLKGPRCYAKRKRTRQTCMKERGCRMKSLRLTCSLLMLPLTLLIFTLPATETSVHSVPSVA
jgi:hypothetical protein